MFPDVTYDQILDLFLFEINVNSLSPSVTTCLLCVNVLKVFKAHGRMLRRSFYLISDLEFWEEVLNFRNFVEIEQSIFFSSCKFFLRLWKPRFDLSWRHYIALVIKFYKLKLNKIKTNYLLYNFKIYNNYLKDCKHLLFILVS